MRTVLISGANRGIGRSIALKALDEGHNLSLGIRNPEDIKGSRLDPKVSDCKRILINKYDARDPNSAKEWVKNTLKHFKDFDTLINCAGIFNRTKFLFKDLIMLVF